MEPRPPLPSLAPTPRLGPGRWPGGAAGREGARVLGQEGLHVPEQHPGVLEREEREPGREDVVSRGASAAEDRPSDMGTEDNAEIKHPDGVERF